MFKIPKLPTVVKRLIIGVIIVFAIFLILGVVAYFQHSKSPPSVQDAPWLIQTSSRIYYAQNFSVQNGTQEIKGFWISNGSGWVYNSGVKSFPTNVFGPINIVRRTSQ